MVVDEFGKEFLRLCDGSRKVNEIVELLRDKSEFADIQQEEVMEFVSSLVNAGFLRTSPMSLEKIERNSALVQVYLHLTHGCNLRCKHCHVSAGTPYEREMSDKRILALIDEISEMEPEELIITGGEPFLHNDFFPLIGYGQRELWIRYTRRPGKRCPVNLRYMVLLL